MSLTLARPLPEPQSELLSVKVLAQKRQNRVGQILGVPFSDFEAIHMQKCQGRCRGGSLVPVKKRTTNGYRHHVARGHIEQIEEILAAVRCARSRCCSLKRFTVSQARITARALDFTPVDVEDVLHIQEQRVGHLRPELVQ